MTTVDKIKEIEAEMARTQKNKVRFNTPLPSTHSVKTHLMESTRQTTKEKRGSDRRFYFAVGTNK